jgi:hypothetical protein
MSGVQTQDRQTFSPDWRALSLGVPAAVFTIGSVAYLGEVFFPGALTQHDARHFGTWLMVVGSEVGSLPAMVEVWRKVGIGRARWYDYFGMVVSTLTTMLGFIIIWAREYIEVDAIWMQFIRQWGPLAALPLTVLDFVFGDGLELGLYLTYKENDARAARLQSLRDELGEETARLEIERQRALLRNQAQPNEQQLRNQVEELRASLQDVNQENARLEAQLRNQAQPNATEAQPAQLTGATKRETVAQLLRDNGRTVAQIAQLVGCSAQYVRKVRGTL